MLAFLVGACGSTGQSPATSESRSGSAAESGAAIGSQADSPAGPGSETSEQRRRAERRNGIIAELERRRAADPDDGMSRHALARVHAGTDPDRALALLAELEGIASWDYRLADIDFPTLAEDPRFQRIVRVLDARAPSPEPSPVGFELDIVDIVPEGVAWDSKRSELLVGSMHQRAVFAADRQGKTRPVVKAAQDGLLGVLGIAVDGSRDQLWVASTVVPFMGGFSAELTGKSALYAFDLATGRAVGRWDPPQTPSQLNDLRLGLRLGLRLRPHARS